MQQNSAKSQKRSLVALVIFSLICLFFFLLFSGLGIWQVERLKWKNNLIAQVDQRIHQPAVPAPSKADWAKVNTDDYAYLPVTLTGQFIRGHEILVNAVADEQAGYWLIAPFERDDHTIVLINRGFIAMSQRQQEARLYEEPSGEMTITGLLRMSERPGFFPRKNDPANNVWYNRNVNQMAQALNLSDVAPYFVDADASLNSKNGPKGGLTMVNFPNSHLVYLITWFTMAAGVLVVALYLINEERKKIKRNR